MKDFSIIELNTYLKNNQPLLLDVHELWDWEKCHLAHSKLLPIRKIIANIDNLDKTKKPLLFVIKVFATRYFDAIGLASVINMRGDRCMGKAN